MIISSCSETNTYADQLKDEKALIKAYIKRKNIEVVSTLPTNTPWIKDGKDVYFLSSTGLYFHLVSPGDISSTDSVETNDVVVPRYKQYTLNVVSDTTSYWTVLNKPDPTTFIFNSGSYTRLCTAFNEAASYMKRNESEAKLIVPSSIGFDENQSPTLIPMGYDIKIIIQK